MKIVLLQYLFHVIIVLTSRFFHFPPWISSPSSLPLLLFLQNPWKCKPDDSPNSPGCPIAAVLSGSTRPLSGLMLSPIQRATRTARTSGWAVFRSDLPVRSGFSNVGFITWDFEKKKNSFATMVVWYHYNCYLQLILWFIEFSKYKSYGFKTFILQGFWMKFY